MNAGVHVRARGGRVIQRSQNKNHREGDVNVVMHRKRAEDFEGFEKVSLLS